jgi:hypothetical protein
MYPVTHATIAVGALKAGERLLPPRWLPLDYRFAAMGGLLPDLIDKPLAWFLVRSLPDDHAWGHTIWLPLLLVAAAVAIRRPSLAAPLAMLGIGALTHIIADPVNAHPRTLLWPLFGSTWPDVRGYLWVFPITMEIVLIAAYFVKQGRSQNLRERASAFVESGAV